MVAYPALFESDDIVKYVISFPDFTWGATQANSDEEAREMAEDALKILLANCVEKGIEIPKPTKRRGRQYRMITLPALQSAKVELYTAFLKSGLRKAELARRMGIPKSNVDRLFDLDHTSRLELIETAFRILNKRLVLEVHEAA